MTAIKPICYPSRGITLTEPNVRNVGTSLFLHQIPRSKDSCLHASPLCKLRKNNLFPRLVHNAMKNTRRASILAFAKKEDSISENEGSQKKVTDGFRRELTVEDVLREHMKGKQLNGGGNGNSFWDGGGFGGLDNEEFQEQLDEVLQVIMATIGVIVLYILITNGQEQFLLARDILKYLCGARTSSRLIRTMEKWRTIYESITWKGSFFK